jgi:hydroxymethylbilane synthase
MNETGRARTITLGSRPSKLALWQTNAVLEQLRAAFPYLIFQVQTMVTEGDRVLDRPLPEIGGKGLFTAELESALRSGEIDLAVHSLKDLPVESVPGLCIGAVGKRANPQDVLVSATNQRLQDLARGARVGTSSLRREAQLRAVRQDLEILPLRGNVDTRIRKARQGDYDAIVLAAAGIERLGLADVISQYLPLEIMLPAPGQGAMVIQCRADDQVLLTMLQSIHDEPTHRAVTAERSFLSALGGGCSAPVAAFAEAASKNLRLKGLVASVDGKQVIRVTGDGDGPLELGQRLARQAIEQGAGALLK